jgi:ABC-type amino acid transport system permease subunit
MVIALIYLFFTFIFSEIVDQAEKRLRIPGTGVPQRAMKRKA